MQAADVLQEKEVKINRCWGYEWRWSTDEKINWHQSYAVDFWCQGKRYVLLKLGLYYIHGKVEFSDNDFDLYLKSVKSEFNDHNPLWVVRKVDSIVLDVPDLQEWGGELWYFPKFSRDLYSETIHYIHFNKCFCLKQNLTDPKPFDKGVQGNLFEDIDLFTGGI